MTLSETKAKGMGLAESECCYIAEVDIPYSAYISQVFNFTNFVNFKLFVKFIQLKFEPLHCQVHGQHSSVKFFQQITIWENFDLQNISAIR